MRKTSQMIPLSRPVSLRVPTPFIFQYITRGNCEEFSWETVEGGVVLFRDPDGKL